MSYVLFERRRNEAMHIKLGLHATGGTLSKVCPQRAFSKRLRTCSNCRPNRCSQPTGEDITYSQSKPHRQTSRRCLPLRPFFQFNFSYWNVRSGREKETDMQVKKNLVKPGRVYGKDQQKKSCKQVSANTVDASSLDDK